MKVGKIGTALLEVLNTRQKLELTIYFSHLADLGQSSSYAVSCVLHKTDQSDWQTMAPQ